MKRHQTSNNHIATDTLGASGAKLAMLGNTALVHINGGGPGRPPENPHPAPGTTDSGSSGTNTGK